MDKNLKKKNLLCITHSYSFWLKDQVEIIAGYFNRVYVLVRYKPIAQVGSLFNSHIFKMHTKDVVFDLNNTPSNVTVIPIPLWYLPTNDGYLSLGDKHLKAVRRIIETKNIRFDIIHAHFVWSAGFVGTKLKKGYSVPLVITAHAYGVNDLPFRSKKWETKIREVLSNADHVITVSQKNKDYIDKIKVNSQVSVIPNGFRKELFHPKDIYESRIKLNLPVDKKIILTVGSLDEIKGHKYLIDSMKEIVNFRKDVICIIIGEGEIRRKLERRIRQNELNEHVILMGLKPHEEIVDWINSCDIFVLPSLSEGNPTVMFETFACGKPFVGTAVGGVPEYTTSDDYGILVEPKNSKSLAIEILRAIDKDWNSKLIIEHSKKYDWEILCRGKVDIYSELLKGQ